MPLTVVEWTTLAIFLAFGCAVFFLAYLFASRRREPNRRPRPAGGRRQAGPLAKALAAQLPLTSGSVSRLDLDLRRAGHYGPSSRTEYLASRNVLIVAVLIMTGIGLVTLGQNNADIAPRVIIAGVVLAVLAYALPRLVLSWQAARRVKRIKRGLPDALDLIAMSVSGGISLPEAVERVAKDLELSHPELAVEFAIVQQQAKIGTFEQAFREMAKRIDVAEVTAVSAFVSQSARLGSNIATPVRDYADGMRRNRRQRADELANRAGVKLLFPVIFCLVPATFLLIWGPSMLKIRNFYREATAEGGALNQVLPAVDASPDFAQQLEQRQQ